MTKTTKTPTPTIDQTVDLLRANGVPEKVTDQWSKMEKARSADQDSMALPSGDDCLRISNYIGWTDIASANREYVSVTTPQDVKDFLDANKGGDVTMLINTPGGSVFGGIEIANMIIGHEGKVTAVVTGIAASVGSLIAAACEEVLMMEASMVMIHGPQTIAYGGASVFRDIADRLDKEASVASMIYKKRMDGDTVDGMLTDGEDHYMTAQEAVESGIADGIYSDDEDDGDDDKDDGDTAKINNSDTMDATTQDIKRREASRLSFLATGMLGKRNGDRS